MKSASRVLDVEKDLGCGLHLESVGSVLHDEDFIVPEASGQATDSDHLDTLSRPVSMSPYKECYGRHRCAQEHLSLPIMALTFPSTSQNVNAIFLCIQTADRKMRR